MFKKEIEELNKAIKHLENDILPSKCNGNISCYNEHTQLYKWLKELKSYKEIRTKNNEDIFEEYAEKWWYNEYSPHTYTNSKEVWKNGAEFGYNKANEWNFTHRNKEHLVIDCPKGEENKLYLLLLNSRDSKEFEFGRKVPVVCYWDEEWSRFERLEHTIGERNVNRNDINAWKEIVLPELPKESE